MGFEVHMGWEYSAHLDRSQDGEDFLAIDKYMSEVRDQALEKLSVTEIAALFEDIKHFRKLILNNLGD